MSHAVVQLTNLDTYRDGGSMIVSFLDDEGVNCTLMFPIKMVAHGSLKFEKLGYLEPRLEIFRRTERVSRVTGLSSFDSEVTSEPVSWEIARGILRQVDPLIRGFDTNNSGVYPEMVAIAKNDGRCNGSA